MKFPCGPAWICGGRLMDRFGFAGARLGFAGGRLAFGCACDAGNFGCAWCCGGRFACGAGVPPPGGFCAQPLSGIATILAAASASKPNWIFLRISLPLCLFAPNSYICCWASSESSSACPGKSFRGSKFESTSLSSRTGRSCIICASACCISMGGAIMLRDV